MISVSGRKWQENEVDKNLVNKIHQQNDFSKILSHLIVSRNFDENEIHLINNDLELNNNFQNNSDFIKSANLIEYSIRNKEKICILGDYDVDGSTATALLVKFLDSINHPYFYYIPDREKDGYGASKKLFEKLILKKPKLVIMVDCGSTSIKAIDYLNDNNIKSLIIDHHEIDKPYPKATAIINPKKNNGYLEYDYLCATTLTYFFLDILIKKTNSKIRIREYLIYVLLATICDVMPLRKLNKLISIKALNEFSINHIPVFKEIYKLNNKKNKININDLGYLIGPILNAGGRLKKSNYATELLSTNDQKIIHKRSVELIKLNDKRKKIESLILSNINFKKIDEKNRDIIIYYNSNINEGLIGIIAARLKDYFNKPSIVITNSTDFLKCSARSTYNYNIGRAIKRAIDKNLILNGGGHHMAGGFTLEKENFENFSKFISQDFLKNNLYSNLSDKYDAEISSAVFKKDFFDDIKKIGPFGVGNPLPTFLFKDFKVLKSKVLDKKHISCILKSKIGLSISSICFNSVDTKIGFHLLNFQRKFNVVGQINENFWNNKKTLQLIIKDLIL